MSSENRRVKQKEIYYMRKKAGLCVGCGCEKLDKTKAYCPTCLDYQAVSHMMHDANMTEEEKKEARKKGNEKSRSLYAQRKEAGLCTDCGAPAIKGKTKCKKCLWVRANRANIAWHKKPHDQKKMKWKEQGLCLLCGAERKPGYQLCEEHWKKTVENAKKGRKRK